MSLGGAVRDGVAVDAPFLGWRDVAFADALAARLDVPVALENDVVALAEAERWFGVGRALPGFAIVTVGAGWASASSSTGAPCARPMPGSAPSATSRSSRTDPPAPRGTVAAPPPC